MKYIIDIDDNDIQKIVALGVTKCGAVYTRKYDIDDDIEELTIDYIKENCKSLLNAEYQRGLEDGKAVNDKGCEGCKYEGLKGERCRYCANCYHNQWTAKDDKIEVGDEVNWLGDCFIVTRIFQPHNMKGQCDGIDDDGCTYHDVLMDDLEKTGRHFDISKILEEMRHD